MCSSTTAINLRVAVSGQPHFEVNGFALRVQKPTHGQAEMLEVLLEPFERRHGSVDDTTRNHQA